ncbi:MAG: sensor histidine kinase [Acidimicrobiia bacterium]|nr:sensor histidine kinase [Acidimicrobiia bacterium]
MSAPLAYEQHVAPRWVRPLAVFIVGFVSVAAFQTKPGPGVHGEHLAVTVALIGLAVGTISMVRLPGASARFVLLVVGVAVLSSAALVGLQPNGPGFLGMFPAVSGAALRLPDRLSGAVTLFAVAALAVAWALAGNRSVDGIVLNEIGVVAFYILSMFARRYRESTEHAHQLLKELEQSRAAQAEAAALNERQRLAREMHDVLAHSLSGLVLNLEGARLLSEREASDGELTRSIERAHRLAKTGLEEARRAIGMLRGDDLPGPDGLVALAAEFQDDTAVACTFDVDGKERELGSDARLTLYRVAQEALTNIRKHASAQRVAVHLVYEASGTRLIVEDVSKVGDGERPLSSAGAGYGLTGMRERAALLGGRLTAGPTESGFRVELWVPA